MLCIFRDLKTRGEKERKKRGKRKKKQKKKKKWRICVKKYSTWLNWILIFSSFLLSPSSFSFSSFFLFHSRPLSLSLFPFHVFLLSIPLINNSCNKQVWTSVSFGRKSNLRIWIRFFFVQICFNFPLSNQTDRRFLERVLFSCQFWEKNSNTNISRKVLWKVRGKFFLRNFLERFFACFFNISKRGVNQKNI